MIYIEQQSKSQKVPLSALWATFPVRGDSWGLVQMASPLPSPLGKVAAEG